MAEIMRGGTPASVESIDSVVIGGRQAGLSVSYWLRQANRPHIVLERDRIGSSWVSRRWDSFTLVTPNWMNRLPGFPYEGPEPDGFLSRAEVVAYLEAYASSFDPPIRLGVEALRLCRREDQSGYAIDTNKGLLLAKNVFVTVGFFHKPKIPACAARISPSVSQMPSTAYKNPAALAPGAVLVVGSAQTGCQIAEELHESGRQVYLCVSSAPREPRRYRGRDINDWFNQMGGFDRTFADPGNLLERYRPNPHCTGKNGGHAINLADFAAKGITLLGRLADGEGQHLKLVPDLKDNLQRAHAASLATMKAVDDHIARNGLVAPPPDETNTDDGFYTGVPEVEELTELDLSEQGVSTIIWATGFSCDFDWIDLPVLDARGYPDQQRGVTRHPGLYFCGLHWMYCLKSGLLFGVGEAAQHVVKHLLQKDRDAA